MAASCQNMLFGYYRVTNFCDSLIFTLVLMPKVLTPKYLYHCKISARLVDCCCYQTCRNFKTVSGKMYVTANVWNLNPANLSDFLIKIKLTHWCKDSFYFYRLCLILTTSICKIWELSRRFNMGRFTLVNKCKWIWESLVFRFLVPKLSRCFLHYCCLLHVVYISTTFIKQYDTVIEPTSLNLYYMYLLLFNSLTGAY